MILVLLILGSALPAVVAGMSGGYLSNMGHSSRPTPPYVRAGLVGQSLDCTNDLINSISCDVKAPNCSLYRLHFLEKNQ